MFYFKGDCQFLPVWFFYSASLQFVAFRLHTILMFNSNEGYNIFSMYNLQWSIVY